MVRDEGREGGTRMLVGKKEHLFYVAHPGACVGSSSILVIVPSKKTTTSTILVSVNARKT